MSLATIFLFEYFSHHKMNIFNANVDNTLVIDQCHIAQGIVVQRQSFNYLM